jgi:hypothetical protein
MNPNLYTEEFRDFKYLKSSPEEIAYYKNNAKLLNSVQPWADVNDPNFIWPCRLEFIEQLLDLKDGTIYIIEPGSLRPIQYRKNSYDYEEARLHIIKKPIMTMTGPRVSPIEPEDILTEDDIQTITNSHQTRRVFICSSEQHNASSIFSIRATGLIPLTKDFDYVAVFYDHEYAKKYYVALTKFLRKENDAISTISKMF